MLQEPLPPFNIEAETGVIGSLLYDPSCIHDVRPVLDPADFFRDNHALIYRAIITLADAGKPFAIEMVRDELERVGHADRFEPCGLLQTLIDLVESVPHAAHAAYCVDMDRQKAISRDLIAAMNQVLHDAYSNRYTAEQQLERAERSIFAVGDRRTTCQVTTIAEEVNAAIVRLDQRMAGVNSGLATGFNDYDSMTGGFHPGKLIILAARPSMGKTALALNIADHVCTDAGTAGLIISLEMTAAELADRAICGRAEIDGGAFAEPSRLTEQNLARLGRALEQFRSSRLFLSDQPAQSIGHISALARRFRARERIDFLMVDYLQLVDADDSPRYIQRHEQVAIMTRGLKQLSKSLKIPILLLWQLNRKAEEREDHRPRMADLRESGAIEQDADVVLLLHRPEYYDSKDQPGEAELIIAKNRGGPTGTVKLKFSGSITRFRDHQSRPDENLGFI